MLLESLVPVLALGIEQERSPDVDSTGWAVPHQEQSDRHLRQLCRLTTIAREVTVSKAS